MTKKAARPRAPATPAANKKGGGKIMVVSFSLIVLVIAALPTTILLAVGMTPTFVALVVDVTPGKYLTRCVAGLNFAGTVPSIEKLWSGMNNISAAFDITGDPFAWLAMYGAAAIGWLLFLGVPGAVTVLRALSAKRRINSLSETQRELLREWGDAVQPRKETEKGATESAVGGVSRAVPHPGHGPRRAAARSG